MTRARTLAAAVALALAFAPRVASAEALLAALEVPEVDGRIVLVGGRTIELRVAPRPGEGYGTLGERVLGRPGFSKALRQANGGTALKAGKPCVVPWDLMRPEWRAMALAAFFPKDVYAADGVTHGVRFATRGDRGETPASIALWFTGRAEPSRLRLPAGRKARLEEGDRVVVPVAVLLPELRAIVASKPKSPPPSAPVTPAPAAAVPSRPEEPTVVASVEPPELPADEPGSEAGAPAEASAESGEVAAPEDVAPPEIEEGESAAPSSEAVAPGRDAGDIAEQSAIPFEDDGTSENAFAFGEGGVLEYRRDARGPYAAYYLKPKEALYSAVVGRFTGRVYADEVNQLAELIAVRSGIDDVTDIPIGHRVKIPLEYLQPQWLPPGHPERVEYEATRRETAKVPKPPKTRELAGVVVVLDSGHGGEDVGAMANEVWESDYVFDIMARIKRILERETAARVIPTIRDAEHDFKVFDDKRLSMNRRESILVTPPYTPVRGSTGLHFRWYLSNYHYRKLLKAGQKPDYVVFTSVHADSLHPSMRGTMVYVPGRSYRVSRFSRATGLYGSRKEVKEAAVATFTSKDLIRSEGLSRQLAAQILAAFQDQSIAVHPSTPVRDHVVRYGKSWIPAVIKYAEVPTAVLLEVCNINNPKDAANLRDHHFRERVARAYVNALRNYYGEAARPKQLEASVR